MSLPPCDHEECGPSTCTKNVMKFGVLRLTDLRIYQFQHKDEMLDAIRSMKERNAGFVPLLWNDGAQTWVVPEVWQ